MLASELQRGGEGEGESSSLRRQPHEEPPAVRYVALPHTEGCGVSDERLGVRTLLGHLTSPLVSCALLLEHGCEKTHNDYFSGLLSTHGLDGTRLGWSSLQADGFPLRHDASAPVHPNRHVRPILRGQHGRRRSLGRDDALFGAHAATLHLVPHASPLPGSARRPAQPCPRGRPELRGVSRSVTSQSRRLSCCYEGPFAACHASCWG